MTGFQSFNDAGTLQFSTEVNAFYFVCGGSFTTSFQYNGLNPNGTGSGDSSRPYYIGKAEASADFDFVVFNAPGAYVIPYNSALYPKTVIGYDGRGQAQYTSDTLRTVKTATDTPSTVYYWCFRSMSYLSPATLGSGFAGLEVYQADGTIAYTSAQIPLKVVQSNSIDYSQTSTNTTSANSTAITVSIPSGTHAFVSFGNNNCNEPIQNTYATSNAAAFGIKENNNGTFSYKKVYGVGKLDIYQPAIILAVDVSSFSAGGTTTVTPAASTPTPSPTASPTPTPTSSITVSISPASQTATATKSAITSHTFDVETISVSGGTASSYNWYFESTNGGSWSVSSGQGTSSAKAAVSSVNSGIDAITTFSCDVVVNGTTYKASCTLEYDNSG